MTSIGIRLKELRLAAGMKQNVAAECMGMSRPTLSAIESGKREVLAGEIPGFAKLYGISPEALLLGENRWEKSKTGEFERFTEYATDGLIGRLKQLGIEEITLITGSIEGPKEICTVASIEDRKTGASVWINLTEMYELIRNEGASDRVINSTADRIAIEMKKVSSDLDILSDYGKIRTKLTMEMLETNRYRELLKNVPHEGMEDLSVVYRIVLNESKESKRTVLVTDRLLERYGIAAERLKADAKENAPTFQPAVIRPMTEMLGIPRKEGDKEVLYVASTENMNRGAGVLAYPGFLEEAANRLESDFFVLPSSIHEILLLVDTGLLTAKELQNLVSSVNRNEVEPEDRLSNHAYHYDSKNHIFESAERYEERLREETIQPCDGERESLLSQLKDKREKNHTREESGSVHGKSGIVKGGERDA